MKRGLITILILCLSFSCAFLPSKNPSKLKIYKTQASHYNCLQLEIESRDISKNINLLNAQIEKEGFFDHFMEFFVSVGIFAFSSQQSLKDNLNLFMQKEKIINKLNTENACKSY